jgi:hypothetical protein
LSIDPAVLTPELEDDIDLSTLRWITGTLRHTFLPYLGWIIAFVSFSKLTRFFSPYLFRATRWTADWGFWVIEKVIKFLAWSCMWLGMAAAVVWLLLGLVLGLVWVAIKAKPVLRRSLVDKTIWKDLAVKVVFSLICWGTARWIFGKRIGNWIVVAIAGLLAWGMIVDERPKSSSTPKSTIPSQPNPPHAAHVESDGKAEEEDHDDEDYERAERWARSVRQEMLRDSLLRRGKSNGTTGKSDEDEADLGNRSVADEVD